MILCLGSSGGSGRLHRLDQAGKIKHPRDGRKGSAKSNRTAGHYTQQLSCGPAELQRGRAIREVSVCVAWSLLSQKKKCVDGRKPLFPGHT